jgi:ubiquinone/menaquinone biosynthesis C-methylase UbiE
MNIQKYINMQKSVYEQEANQWSLDNKDPVVGSYNDHNNWADYDTYLFRDVDTTGMIALEYGCGPGRNLIKFNNRFTRIDGVDIANNNLEKAKINLAHNNISNFNLYLCDGQSIPVNDELYDVVFSVICLQHIACYDVRFNIFKEIYRSLKPGGYFCFQMGYGGKAHPPSVGYYDNVYDAQGTNGACDVSVTDETTLINDLVDKLSFTNYKSDIRPTGPGDGHTNWIWVQVQK